MKHKRVIIGFRRRKGQKKPYPITKPVGFRNQKKIIQKSKSFKGVSTQKLHLAYGGRMREGTQFLFDHEMGHVLDHIIFKKKCGVWDQLMKEGEHVYKQEGSYNLNPLSNRADALKDWKKAVKKGDKEAGGKFFFFLFEELAETFSEYVSDEEKWREKLRKKTPLHWLTTIPSKATRKTYLVM